MGFPVAQRHISVQKMSMNIYGVCVVFFTFCLAVFVYAILCYITLWYTPQQRCHVVSNDELSGQVKTGCRDDRNFLVTAQSSHSV